jgi:2-dehydro-3-deoxyphosphogluconate aldolase/(4S)-4-hydroxy-2-oxoglutarate aldolase
MIDLGRVVPVIVLDRAEDAEPLGAALAAGGLRAAEVTFRTPAAAEAIRILSERDDLVVGAGTVVSQAQVDQAAAAGARFVVSPGFSSRVIARCRTFDLPALPGAATPTEIQMAVDAGLDTVKFFPAEQLGGVPMLRALSAPFRTMRFFPTGGVSRANMSDYLALPSVVAVGGTWFVSASLIEAGAWGEISRLAAQAVAVAA